jgi:hypothetical protein
LSTGPIGKEQAMVTIADEVAFSLPTAAAATHCSKIYLGICGCDLCQGGHRTPDSIGAIEGGLIR